MKERLTGAIILVALLVLLVPELLTGPGPEPAPLAHGSEGAPMRSYTIDLADDAAKRTASAPTSTPSTAATDESAGQAETEAGAEDAGDSGTGSPEGDSEGVATSSGTAVAGSDGASDRTSGSGADTAAASPPGSSTATGQESAPGVDDDRPRSAFGPNAVSRAPAEPATGSSGRPTASESSRTAADSRRAAASESSRTAAESRRAATSEPSRATAEARRSAASESSASKGWAVQLGVFASRENAERLAKQIKGKGYAVTVNETSGNGKRLFRVRVGPEAERSTAVAVGAKLRASGHSGTVVAW